MKEDVYRNVFISRQSRHFFFIVNIIKVLFPICILTWRVSNYVSRQGRGINRRNESIIFQESYYHFVIQLTVNIDTSYYCEELHFVLLPSLV